MKKRSRFPMIVEVSFLGLVTISTFFFAYSTQKNLQRADSASAASTSYYVSPSGSDSNSGKSTSSPFKTIPKAINTAVAGDSIQVRTGTYLSFTVDKNNLTISGYSGERPLLSGGSGVKLSGSNVTFSNFEVTAMSADKSGAVLSTGSSNIIKNNIVRDNTATGTNGILIMGANNQVESNTVYNNNRMGIGIYNSSGNIVSKNTVYRNKLSTGDSDGIHCIGDSVGQSNTNTISENNTYENADDGIDMWNCTNNQVINNTSHHNGGTGDGHGIKVGLGGKNTVKGNTSYSNLACGFTSNCGGNYYENNIAHSNTQCGFTDSCSASYRAGNTDPSSFINNRAYNNPTNYIKGTYTTVFTGNSESPGGSPTTPPTTSPTATPVATITPIPTTSATATPRPTASVTPRPATATPRPTSTIPSFTSTPTPVPTNSPTLSAVGSFKAEYFDNRFLSGKPSLVRYDKAINFDWGKGSPAPSVIRKYYFSIRWTKSENFVGGKYRFTLKHDDGLRIYLDDKLIYDKWGSVVKVPVTLDHYISSGSHNLKVEYREIWGNNFVFLSYSKLP